MKKPILTCFLFLVMPFFGRSQNPQLIEDFAKHIKTSTAFAFNGHLNIMQTSSDDDKFNLTAINDKMQVVWKTTLNGYNIQVDKFKDKVLALASSSHSTVKGTNNTFIAYLLDAETGKLLLNKVIYQSSDEYFEFPQMCTGDGNFFELAVRQCGIKRNIGLGAGYVAFFSNKYTHEYNETRNIKVTTYNEQLDSVSTFKPIISNGTFISLTWNKNADIFISWFNGPSIEVYKYNAGKTTPANQLTVPVAFKENKNLIPKNLLFMQPSENKNVLYYSMIYLNENKDPELGIGKLDFGTSKNLFVTQVIDKKVLKAVKKSFIPANKSIDDVDFGNTKGMNIKYVNEVSGKLIITMASNMSVSGGYGSALYENSLLLNVCDENLNLKFQQVLPANSKYPNKALTTSYHISGNKLYLVANAKKGLAANVCIYGALNLNTGKWEAMDYLSKKHIDNNNFSEGSSVLWYDNNYIVPYFDPKGLMDSKYNVTLQLNNY